MTVTSVPNNVVTTWPFVSIPDITLSPTTWWSKIFVRRGVLLKTLKSVPPRAVKAASVGANTVNGPGPDKVASNEHESIAAFKYAWSVELETISYTEFEYKHDPSSIVAVASKFSAVGSVHPLQEEFHNGLVESLGKTNISVGPKIKPTVSFINVGTCVIKLYTYANWQSPQLSTSAGPSTIPLQSTVGGELTVMYPTIPFAAWLPIEQSYS